MDVLVIGNYYINAWESPILSGSKRDVVPAYF